MVDPNGGFIMRKQTFIVKNFKTVDEVYIREKKVSIIPGLPPIIQFFFIFLFSQLAKEPMAR